MSVTNADLKIIDSNANTKNHADIPTNLAITLADKQATAANNSTNGAAATSAFVVSPVIFSTGEKTQSQAAQSSQATPQLEPVFFTRSLNTIKYLDQDQKEYTEISIQKLIAITGMQGWNDGLLIQPQLRDKIWLDKTYPKTALTEVEARLHNPLTSLVVRKVNEQVGHKLGLASDAKPILAGEIVIVYGAEVLEFDNSAEDDFSITLNGESHQSSIVQSFYKKTSGSARRFGNLARFILSAPTKTQLSVLNDPEKNKAIKTSIDPFTVSCIGTENVCFMPAIHKGCPVNCVIAMRDIFPNEDLFVDYGSIWWKSRAQRGMTPFLFNRYGEIIGTLSNTNEIILDPKFKPNQSLVVPPILKLKEGDFDPFDVLDSPIGTIDFMTYNTLLFESIFLNFTKDAYDHQKRFIEDVNLALDIFTKRFSITTDAGKYVRNLKQAFNKESHTLCDDRFRALHEILTNKVEYEKVKIQLAALKAELVFHMQKYNEGNTLAKDKKQRPRK